MSALPIPLPTKDGIELLLQEIQQQQTLKETMIATRDAEIQDISKPYQTEIDRAEEVITKNAAIVEAWANANLSVFNGRQSITLAGVQLGWRKGQWSLVIADSGKKEDVVAHLQAVIKEGELPRATAKMREAAAIAKMLLIVEYSLDSKLAISKSNTPEVLELLGEAGAHFEQKQRFFIKPDRKGQDGPTIKTEE